MVELSSELGELGASLASLWCRLRSALRHPSGKPPPPPPSTAAHRRGKPSYRYQCCTLSDRPGTFDDVGFGTAVASRAAAGVAAARSYQSHCCRPRPQRAATAPPEDPLDIDEGDSPPSRRHRPRPRRRHRPTWRHRLSADCEDGENLISDPGRHLLSPTQQQTFRKLSRWWVTAGLPRGTCGCRGEVVCLGRLPLDKWSGVEW